MPEVGKQFAFVVSRIGSDLSPERAWANAVSKHVIGPALSEFGIELRRADLVATPDVISVRIVEDIMAARVVIVDLTGQNANVYYELAIAHAFGRPVVLLVDHPDNLAFDISHHRAIPLGTSESPLSADNAETARAALCAALTAVLADDYRPVSVVTEAANSRLVKDNAAHDPQAQELADLRTQVEILATEVQRVVRRTKPTFAEALAPSTSPQPVVNVTFHRAEFGPQVVHLRVYPSSNPLVLNGLAKLVDGRIARFPIGPMDSMDEMKEAAVTALRSVSNDG